MRHSGGPRVVITGIGVVSPFGVGRERFWQCVSAGCSGTRAITEFDASTFGCRVAAPVEGVTIDDVSASVMRSNNAVGGRIVEVNGRENFVRGQGYVLSWTGR